MTETSKLQISAEGIDKLYTDSNGLNMPLVQEAYRQVELKLQDEQVRKQRIDARVYTLLTVQLTLIGLIVGVVSTADLKPLFLILLSTVGLIITTGAFCLFQALKSNTYAPLGTYPHSWLTEGYLINHTEVGHNEQVLTLTLARLLHAQEANITAGDESSCKRLKWLNRSLKLSQLSMLPIAMCLVVKILQLASSLCS